MAAGAFSGQNNVAVGIIRIIIMRAVTLIKP